MAQLKFYRKSKAPASPVAGAIWFNTTDKTIQVYTGTAWEAYAGNLKDATWSNDNKTLTITKHDGSSIGLNFSDMASATVMGSMIAAIGLDSTTGAFKSNAENYGGSSIGEEIKNIDAAVKALSDSTSADLSGIKGTLSEEDAKTLEAINDELDGIDGKIATIEEDYLKNADKTDIISTLTGDSSDTADESTIFGAKAFATAQAYDAFLTAKRYVTEEILSLDVTDTAVANSYVSAVSETDGKISVSREVLPVTGVANNDKVLTLSNGEISSTITLSYVKADKKIYLYGVDTSTPISSIDATDFVADSFLDDVDIDSDDNITFTWKMADGSTKSDSVNISKYIDTYLADNNTITLSDKTFSVNTNVIATKKSVDDLSGTVTTLSERESDHYTEFASVAGITVNGKKISSTSDEGVISGANVTLSGDDVLISGYSKKTAGALTATDTINEALGKLEASVDAAAAGGVQTVNGISGNIVIQSGSANGTIAVHKAGSSKTDVAITGLKSAAFTESTDYATAAQGALADTAYQKPYDGINTNDLHNDVKTLLGKGETAYNALENIYTKTEVDSLLSWVEWE